MKVKCFIISYNRPTFLRMQVSALQENPRLDLIVVDNDSGYETQELLTQLQLEGVRVIRLKHNFGHRVVWENHLSKTLCLKENYIVTDCDVMPPVDVDYLDVLEDGLRKFPKHNKVGLELDTHNIPDGYPRKKDVLHHELSFIYRKYLKSKYYMEAPVDTTFALYRAGYHSYSVWGTPFNVWRGECLALRTVKIKATHLSWHLVPPYDAETVNYYNLIKHSQTGHWKL